MVGKSCIWATEFGIHRSTLNCKAQGSDMHWKHPIKHHLFMDLYKFFGCAGNVPVRRMISVAHAAGQWHTPDNTSLMIQQQSNKDINIILFLLQSKLLTMDHLLQNNKDFTFAWTTSPKACRHNLTLHPCVIKHLIPKSCAFICYINSLQSSVNLNSVNLPQDFGTCRLQRSAPIQPQEHLVGHRCWMIRAG